MKGYLLLIISAIFLILTSCRKNSEDINPNPPAQTTNNLKVSGDFSWQTSKMITLELEGLATQVPYQSTLSVETGDGETCLQVNYKLSENLITSFSVPAKTSEVKLKYGNLEKTIIIQDDKVFYSFIPIEQ